jgi:nicotinamidase-related amidase
MTSQRTRMTRENTAVLLIDHQVGLFTGVRDMPIQDLKRSVVGLAKGAKVLGLPIVAITTARDSLWGRPSLSWRPSWAAKSWTAPPSTPGIMSPSSRR